MGAPLTDRPDALSLKACAAFPADLTLLLHAAVNQVTIYLDRAAIEMGLKDARDWLVLAALDDGVPRTQLELSRVVCVDKTTLIAVLDRLEQQELVVRTVDPTDRRVRIPQITDAGCKVFATFAAARDEAEARAFAGVDERDRAVFLDLLAKIANGQDDVAAV